MPSLGLRIDIRHRLIVSIIHSEAQNHPFQTHSKCKAIKSRSFVVRGSHLESSSEAPPPDPVKTDASLFWQTSRRKDLSPISGNNRCPKSLHCKSGTTLSRRCADRRRRTGFFGVHLSHGSTAVAIGRLRWEPLPGGTSSPADPARESLEPADVPVKTIGSL